MSGENTCVARHKVNYDSINSIYRNSVVCRDFCGCLYSGCMVSVFRLVYKPGPIKAGQLLVMVYVLFLYILCPCYCEQSLRSTVVRVRGAGGRGLIPDCVTPKT